jgi:hypothetical protein
MLNSVEPYGIIITNGDNDTFPLWYAQEVEGVRQDVLVLVTSYLNTDWFVRQMIRNPVREYDAAKGPAIYRDKVWPKPTKPPLNMTFAQADAQPQGIEIREPQVFKQDDIVATIQPGILTRDQIIVLSLIKDSYPQRPIYFSTGGYSHSLGLNGYSLRQGIVEKLMPQPIKEGKDTIKVGDSFLDIPTSYKLWSEVYQAPKELIKEGKWIDRPSFGIPYTYTVTGYVLAQALKANGNDVASQRVTTDITKMAEAARISDVLASLGADR